MRFVTADGMFRYLQRVRKKTYARPVQGGHTQGRVKGRAMLYIVIKLDERPGTDVLGVKEDVAMYCEKFGDIRLIDVNATRRTIAEQMRLMEEGRRA